MGIGDGLLIAGALGKGLSTGVDSYQAARKQRLDEEQAENERSARQTGLLLQAAKEGYSIGPDNGLTETEYGKSKRTADINKETAEANYYNTKAKEKPVDPFKVNTLVTNLKKDLDADASRTGNFGQISNTVIQAQKLKKMALDAQGGVQNLTGPQQEELAMGVAKMLGGTGGVSDSRVHALVPASAAGNLQDTLSWLKNEPLGRNQQEFTKLMLETLNREEELSNDQLNGIRSKRLKAHSALKKLDPDSYNSVVREYGLDPTTGQPLPKEPKGMLDKHAGMLKDPAAHPADNDALAWAKQNPNDKRAQKILQLNGVQ